MQDKLKEIGEIIKYGQIDYRPKLHTGNGYVTRIFVVGCGGTGSRLIPLIAQHIANHNNECSRVGGNQSYIKHQMELNLIDMDIVEPKNLKRQNFFAFDVGKNKAACLAERYSALYGLDINAFTGKFSECSSDISGRSGNYFFFDCTDNVDARRSIERFQTYATIISCGNEDTFGQVHIGNTAGSGRSTYMLVKSLLAADRMIKSPLSMVSKDDDGAYVNFVESLPTFLTVFKGFKDTEKPSCTEMVLQDEQSMPINSLVAQLAYNVFYSIVSKSKITYNLVKCSIDNQFHTTFIANPVKYRTMLFKAIFGICDEAAEAVLPDLIARIDRSYNLRFPDLEAYVAERGVYSIPLLKICHEHSYMITGDESVKLAALIAKTEAELNEKIAGA